MRESEIEKHLKKSIESMGGMCLKFGGRNLAGMPDRVVIIPQARAYFVELKAPGKAPRKLQTFIHQQFAKRGFLVRVLDTKEKVDDFCEAIANGLT